MKSTHLKLACLAIAIAIASCSALKVHEPGYAIDPVCHMKVDKGEGFTYKYKEVKYYFDNVNCQKAFSMDPENILKKNNCEVKQ
jgi:YHS domain-containing protein